VTGFFDSWQRLLVVNFRPGCGHQGAAIPLKAHLQVRVQDAPLSSRLSGIQQSGKDSSSLRREPVRQTIANKEDACNLI
jgi:hypothetical protein